MIKRGRQQRERVKTKPNNQHNASRNSIPSKSLLIAAGIILMIGWWATMILSLDDDENDEMRHKMPMLNSLDPAKLSSLSLSSSSSSTPMTRRNDIAAVPNDPVCNFLSNNNPNLDNMTNRQNKEALIRFILREHALHAHHQQQMVERTSQTTTSLGDDKEASGKIDDTASFVTLNATQLCASLLASEYGTIYGQEAVILGQETCYNYNHNDPGRHHRRRRLEPRVAGLFHTGTNALARLLELNFGNKGIDDNNHGNVNEYQQEESPPSQPLRQVIDNQQDLEASYRQYDVPWGKHALLNHPDNKHDPILTIVLVRDPLRWMQKMCKVPYDATWQRDEKVRQHCPNLVMQQQYTNGGHDTNDGRGVANDPRTTRVYVTDPNGGNGSSNKTESFESLADMWNEWNHHYLQPWQGGGPRLIIRSEDLFFHPKTVLDTIASCLNHDTDGLHRQGKELKQQLQYIWFPPSKSHGFTSDYLAALEKYGTLKGRHKGMSRADKIYANQALNRKGLMNIFHYPLIPINQQNQGKNNKR